MHNVSQMRHSTTSVFRFNTGLHRQYVTGRYNCKNFTTAHDSMISEHNYRCMMGQFGARIDWPNDFNSELHDYRCMMGQCGARIDWPNDFNGELHNYRCMMGQ